MKRVVKRVFFLTLLITAGGIMGSARQVHANDLTETGDVLQIATVIVWVEDTETGEIVIDETACRPEAS